MIEMNKTIVYDKTTRRNRTISDYTTDKNGVRWYLFSDGGNWVKEVDTEEAIEDEQS